jgi:CRISPR/Cas system-associated exonuclease Cas4 (RecB family)
MQIPFLRSWNQRGLHAFSGKSFTSPSLRGYSLKRQDCGRNVTVTAICDHLYCPRYAYLRHVLGMNPRMTPYTSRALFQHNVFVKLLGKGCDFVVLPGSFLQAGLELAEAEYDRLQFAFGWVGFGRSEEMALIHRKIVEAGLKWLSSLTGEHRRRQTEVSFAAARIGIRGARIDLVEDGHPVEVKAGKASVVNEFHILQLAWYALVLEFCLGIDVDSADVFFVNTLGRGVVFIADEMRLWATKTREETARTLERGTVPDLPCRRRGCFLTDSCRRV